MSSFDVHKKKYELFRKVLEDNKEVFGDNTYSIWNKFQELENKIRPGQAYGGRINGEQLEKTENAAKIIFDTCNEVIRKKNPTEQVGEGHSQEESHENAERI